MAGRRAAGLLSLGYRNPPIHWLDPLLQQTAACPCREIAHLKSSTEPAPRAVMAWAAAFQPASRRPASGYLFTSRAFRCDRLGHAEAQPARLRPAIQRPFSCQSKIHDIFPVLFECLLRHLPIRSPSGRQRSTRPEGFARSEGNRINGTTSTIAHADDWAPCILRDRAADARGVAASIPARDFAPPPIIYAHSFPAGGDGKSALAYRDRIMAHLPRISIFHAADERSI